VRQLPALELASGNFQKEVESLIVSHVSDEASMFVQDGTGNDTDFTNLLTYNFGKNPVVTASALKHFPSPQDSNGKWKTQKQRVHDFVQTTVFTCNVRYVAEAYKGKTYHVQYSGQHGSDITATFYNPGYFNTAFSKFAQQYQSYLTSHARTGDPNKLRMEGTIKWPKVEWGPTLSKVLAAGDNTFKLIEDKATTADDCDWWKDIMAVETSEGGKLFL
jgi:carboxylesterase type B